MSHLTRRALLSGLAATIFGGSATAGTLTCRSGEYLKFGFTEPDRCVPHSPEVQALLALADGEPEPAVSEADWVELSQTDPAQTATETTPHSKQATSLRPVARPRSVTRRMHQQRTESAAAKPNASQPPVAKPAVRTAPTKGVRYIHATSRFDGKTHRVPYFADGEYIDDNNNDVNQLLCDWRTGHTTDIKRAVLDYQWQLYQQLEVDEPWLIISGFRSPQTNAALRAKSNGGVAKRSLHMVGMALDLRLQSRSAVHIFQASYALGLGGTAPYSGSNFTHIDCGRRRTWGEGLQHV